MYLYGYSISSSHIYKYSPGTIEVVLSIVGPS